MEEEYGAWNDDEDGIARELEKTITGSGEDFVALASAAGLQDDEVKMGLQLFDLVTDNNEDYELKIQGVTDNWDPGRIAIIDLLCIKLALAEFLSFPQVPVKVSINEYLEVVKDYSTPNSGRFLNGVLDKLRIKLEKDASIQKTGRGLRDK
jgi:N utilization substance protein B